MSDDNSTTTDSSSVPRKPRMTRRDSSESLSSQATNTSTTLSSVASSAVPSSSTNSRNDLLPPGAASAPHKRPFYATSVRLKAHTLFLISLACVQVLIVLLTIYVIWPSYATTDKDSGNLRGVSMAAFTRSTVQLTAKRLENLLTFSPAVDALEFFLQTGNRSLIDAYTQRHFGVSGLSSVVTSAPYKTLLGLDYVGIHDSKGNLVFESSTEQHTGTFTDNVSPMTSFGGCATFGNWKTLTAAQRLIGNNGTMVFGKIMTDTSPQAMAEFIGMCVTMWNPSDTKVEDAAWAVEQLKDRKATADMDGWITQTNYFLAKQWFGHSVPVHAQRTCPSGEKISDQAVQTTYVLVTNGPLIRVDNQMQSYDEGRTGSIKLLIICSVFIWLLLVIMVTFTELDLARRMIKVLKQLEPAEYEGKSMLKLLALSICDEDEISKLRRLIKNRLRSLNESVEQATSAVNAQEKKLKRLLSAMRTLNMQAGRNLTIKKKANCPVREMTLEEILQSPFSVEYFKNFCMDEQATESIFFLLDVFDLVTQQDKAKSQQTPEVLKRMQDIYANYVSPDTATRPLNIGSSTTRKIIQKFAALTTGQKIPDDVFDDAASEIAQMLKSDTLKRFYADTIGQARAQGLASIMEVQYGEANFAKGGKGKDRKGVKFFFKRVLFGDTVLPDVQDLFIG